MNDASPKYQLHDLTFVVIPSQLDPNEFVPLFQGDYNDCKLQDGLYRGTGFQGRKCYLLMQDGKPTLTYRFSVNEDGLTPEQLLAALNGTPLEPILAPGQREMQKELHARTCQVAQCPTCFPKTGNTAQPAADLVRYVRVERTVRVFALHPMSLYGDMDEQAIKDFEVEASREGHEHFEQVTEMVQTVPEQNIDNSVRVTFEDLTEEKAAEHQI